MCKAICVLLFVCLQQIIVAQTNAELIARFKMLSDKSENTGLHTGQVDSTRCVKMLQIAEEIDNDSLLAISYNLIGEYISRIKGDNITGLDYYFKAIPLAKKSNDKRRLSSIYFDISLIYFTLQNNDESVKYVRKGGINLPEKSHPMYDFMLAQYQRGMATYFAAIKKADSTLAYAQPLILTSRKLESPLFEFSALFLTGTGYELAGDNDLAATYFKKAASISDSVNSPFGLLRFGLNYIPFLLKNKRIADAKAEAAHLFNIGLQLENNDIKLAGAGFMRQAYDSLQQTDSAYYYARMEVMLNATIFNQDNINKMQALRFDEQIRNMEEADKLRDAATARKQNIQFALLAFAIVIFVIIFLFLSRSFITNERLIEILGVIALLLVFEFLNLLLHPFLEKVTHHSPVLMLLALVCIAALLVPMHHKVEHWATKKLVEKNKQIRLAAAKKTIEKLEGS